ncbi:MAG: hypothetical protein ABIQ60_15600 [Burkholderiaceae bacterium]
MVLKMSYYYAQIQDGKVVGLLDTHSPIDDPDMIEIPSMDRTLLGNSYDAETGQFTA